MGTPLGRRAVLDQLSDVSSRVVLNGDRLLHRHGFPDRMPGHRTALNAVGSGETGHAPRGRQHADNRWRPIACRRAEARELPHSRRRGGPRLLLSHPANGSRCEGKARARRPPLLVHEPRRADGGYQQRVSTCGMQYYTSRGWAVVDVNYRGSSGYGRSYRHGPRTGRLGHSSTCTDCEDAVSVISSVQGRRGSGSRVAIRGGSAGGFTTLAALTTTGTFRCGRQPLRYRRPDRAGLGYPQIRIPLSGRTARRRGGARGSFPDPSPGQIQLPGDLLPGQRRQSRSAQPVPGHGRRVEVTGHTGGLSGIPG